MKRLRKSYDLLNFWQFIDEEVRKWYYSQIGIREGADN